MKIKNYYNNIIYCSIWNFSKPCLHGKITQICLWYTFNDDRNNKNKNNMVSAKKTKFFGTKRCMNMMLCLFTFNSFTRKKIYFQPIRAQGGRGYDKPICDNKVLFYRRRIWTDFAVNLLWKCFMKNIVCLENRLYFILCKNKITYDE